MPELAGWMGWYSESFLVDVIELEDDNEIHGYGDLTSIDLLQWDRHG